MSIDWASFTPWSALAGGVLIGAATALLLWSAGAVAGVSGIVGALLRPNSNGAAWRLAFVAGLLAAPLAYGLFATLPTPRIDADTAALIAGGLLVGLGTRYAAGCTSGHGVCGLSRLSARSLAATACFMAAGFATVFVVQHLIA